MPTTHTGVVEGDSAIDRIFGPVIQPQTWINVLYLLVSFPLGILYFVLQVAVFSVGMGLLPIMVGLFVLWFGFLAADILGEVERTVMNTMLGAAIPGRPPAPPVPGNVFRQMFAAMSRPGTWKRIIYLFIRFPMGIMSFVFAVTLISVSLGLLTLPFTYNILPFTVGTTRIETFDEAIYCCCFGAVFTLVSVHVLNSWTLVCKRLGQAMLS